MRILGIMWVGLVLMVAGCAGPPHGEAETKVLEDDVAIAISVFRIRDPGLSRWFADAHAYAVFPSVAKGGLVIGGASGGGLVYEGGQLIGWAGMSQGTIGLQLGGQSFREVVFFKDQRALDQFTSGTFQFSVNASAVAVEAGASTAVDYNGGVAVFTMTRAGLMFEASIGGQKFSFEKM